MTSSSPTQGELDDLLGAAKEGNIRRLEYLIQEKQLPVDTRGPNDEPYWNKTLFLISCEHGQLAAMEKLLQLGADVNAIDQDGYNAMHVAAVYGQEGVLQWLLQKHPDMIMQTDNNGYNAMHLAAMMGNDSIVSLLIQKHPDMIKQTNNNGYNAMHLAARNGYDGIVSLLIQKHPDMIKQTNNGGNTPLDYAVLNNKPSVVWTMVKVHKVDITHCQESRRETAKRLLAAEEARRAKSKNTSSSNEGDSNASTQVLTSDQPNHQNLLPYFDGVSDWKRLGLYLLPEKYTPRIDDIDRSHKQYVPDCRWELTTEYLKVGEVSWNKVIYALEKSGHPNIAGKIRRDVFNIDDVSTRRSTDQQQSHNTTASGTNVSTTPSTDHEKHDQSHVITASVSDVLVSTKPSTDQKRHEQSHSKTASIGDVLTSELSSDVKKHQQSRNTTASDTDLSAKPSGEHKRCEPQSHSTAASGTSTKRRCVEM